MPEALSKLTLRALVENSMARFGDRPALSWVDGEPLTFRDLYESSKTLSLWLSEQGVGFGDSVAILAENGPHWGVAYFAVTSMGAVVVPILTEFHPEAVQYIIRHSEAKVVFVSEKLYPKVEDAAFDPMPLFVNLETFQPMEQGITRDRMREMKEAGLTSFRKLRESFLRMTNAIPDEPGEDDVAAIIYTSGTTGHSKGVVLTHKNIVSNAAGIKHYFELAPDDRLLSVLPLPHTYECTVGLILPMLRGSSIYYLDKPPTGRVLVPAMKKIQPTGMLVVPLIIEKMFRGTVLPRLTRSGLLRFLYKYRPIRRFLHKMAGKKVLETFGGQLRVMAIGGAGIAPDVEMFLRDAEFPYVIGYGLTEAAPLLAASSIEKTRYLSTGYAMPGVSLRIDNPDENGEGELLGIGPNIMREYLKSPMGTAEAITEDGWLRTGDLAKIDKDGYVYIKGRSKNLILGPSGENIYPEEVEAIICQSPYVLEALVFQHEGRLYARVHLDQARLDEEFAALSVEDLETKTVELMEALRQTVNSKVSSFIRIQNMIRQPEPFEKTPTQKIKRYLYTGM
ncbi:AMP-binding protein [Desulfovibrio sp. OttesenSCG-928-I05]|nr:AMP-binding protein [Desulfovibrio sp. OttesenSCG-928-I05]